MTNTLNIKLDDEIVNEVNYLLKDMDLTIEEVIKMFLKRLVCEKKIPFDNDFEFNKDITGKMLCDNEITFESVEEFLDYCND